MLQFLWVGKSEVAYLVVLAQHLLWHCGHSVGWGCRHLKAWRGWRICFQGSLSCPKVSTDGWWKGSVLPHIDFTTGLTECPYDLAADFPKTKWSKTEKEQGGSHEVFYELALEKHTLSFLPHHVGYPIISIQGKGLRRTNFQL